jgi:hypothetical protein
LLISTPLCIIEGVALMNQQKPQEEIEMLVDYDSLVNELSSVLSKCRLATHRARVKALTTLLQGLLLLCEASLSGMGRAGTYITQRRV